MDIKIEKGIPSPNRGSNYPFAQMEIGDSFVAPKKLRYSLSFYQSRHGMKFSSSNKGVPEGMIRIWRIE